MSGLAGLFSTLDALKRKVSDTAQNPILALQQLLGNANDQARGLNELNSQATTAQEKTFRGQQPTPQEQAAEQQLVEALASGYNPAGITLWHGSPYKFSKFDSTKIGTGEGGQLHGRGTYLGEAQATGQSYKDSTSRAHGVYNYLDNNNQPIDPNAPGMSHLKEFYQRLGHVNPGKVDVKAYNERLADQLYHYKVKNKDDYFVLEQKAKREGDARTLEIIKELKQADSKKIGEILEGFKRIKDVKAEIGGYLYKTDVPDAEVAKMLDLDKPLAKQAAHVRDSLIENPELPAYWKRALKGEKSAVGMPTDKEDGNRLLQALLKLERDQQVDYTKLLKDSDVPGLRYLDSHSRHFGGTSNFVVLPGREDLITILERNGLPIK